MDECSLGHQYLPTDLVNPKSTLSGKKPEMREALNWYCKLGNFYKLLAQWVEQLEQAPGSRKFVTKTIREFLEPPAIYVKRDQLYLPEALQGKLPLELKQKDNDTWKQWWCSKDSKVYQFIGEDNVYFYGPAEISMFMGEQGEDPSVDPPEGEL